MVSFLGYVYTHVSVDIIVCLGGGELPLFYKVSYKLLEENYGFVY